MMDRTEAAEKLEQIKLRNLRFHLELANRTLFPDGNTLISPLGVNFLLGLMMEGASGRTKKELAEVLGLDPEFAMAYCKALFTGFPGMSVENLMAIHDGISLNEDFEQKIRGSMGCAIEQMNLHDSTAVKTINDWVSSKTNGKITNLIDYLSPTSLMVAVNAIHFKKGWAVPFDQASPGTFKNAKGEIVEVEMMNKESNRFYGVLEIEGICLVAALPYTHAGRRDDEIMMVLILPKDESVPVEDVLSEIDAETWSELMENLDTRSINVTIPKFEFDNSYNSNQILDSLKKMGVMDAFNFETADFSGMTDDAFNNMFISRIIQSTFIKVDEQGTEAAAGTAGEFRSLSCGEVPDFVLDRPFAFCIVDKNIKIPSFIGIVRDPSQK